MLKTIFLGLTFMAATVLGTLALLWAFGQQYHLRWVLHQRRMGLKQTPIPYLRLMAAALIFVAWIIGLAFVLGTILAAIVRLLTN